MEDYRVMLTLMVFFPILMQGVMSQMSIGRQREAALL